MHSSIWAINILTGRWWWWWWWRWTSACGTRHAGWVGYYCWGIPFTIHIDVTNLIRMNLKYIWTQFRVARDQQLAAAAATLQFLFAPFVSTPHPRHGDSLKLISYAIFRQLFSDCEPIHWIKCINKLLCIHHNAFKRSLVRRPPEMLFGKKKEKKMRFCAVDLHAMATAACAAQAVW